MSALCTCGSDCFCQLPVQVQQGFPRIRSHCHYYWQFWKPCRLLKLIIPMNDECKHPPWPFIRMYLKWMWQKAAFGDLICLCQRRTIIPKHRIRWIINHLLVPAWNRDPQCIKVWRICLSTFINAFGLLPWVFLLVSRVLIQLGCCWYRLVRAPATASYQVDGLTCMIEARGRWGADDPVGVLPGCVQVDLFSFCGMDGKYPVLVINIIFGKLNK